MRHRSDGESHIYVCDKCPGILVEYWGDEDLDYLREFVDSGTRTKASEKAIDFVAALRMTGKPDSSGMYNAVLLYLEDRACRAKAIKGLVLHAAMTASVKNQIAGVEEITSKNYQWITGAMLGAIGHFEKEGNAAWAAQLKQLCDKYLK